MTNRHEKTIAQFYSSYHRLAKASDDLAIEDARFIKFTELLQLGNIIENPTLCRYEGMLSNLPWNILGYSMTEERNRDGDDLNSEELEESSTEIDNDEFNSTYRFTFINGFFEGENSSRFARKSELEQNLKRVHRFVESTLQKQNEFIVQDEHEIQDLQRSLIDCFNSQKVDNIEFIIITDTIIQQEDLPRTVDLKGYDQSCNVSYWDLQRWSELKHSKSKREPVNFSFDNMGYTPVSASLKNDVSGNVNCYLAIIPGGLIADLYDLYHTRLLESNVRVFLSLKRPTNREMVETITSKPHMFLSYNNGLSATASSVTTDENGCLNGIEDFQIVNGGQTTATLYHAKKRLKKDLMNVSVQLKLTVIKDVNLLEIAIPNISKSANTQTAIRKSDFHANLPFLIEISKLSAKTYITTENGINKYYFFERMAGQYNEEKSRQGKGVRLREFERRYPFDGKFDKIDLGRWKNILAGFPHIAASSAEKSFEYFITQIKDKKQQMSSSSYKDLVGFGMLFRRTRKVCGTKKGRQFPSVIGDSSVAMATTIYTTAFIHYSTRERFDYHLLFDQKFPEDYFDNFLRYTIKKIWQQLERYGGTSVQEQTKKPDAWNFVKENVAINKEQLNFLDQFILTDKDIAERNLGDIDDSEKYFNLLIKYFSSDSSGFVKLYDIAHLIPQYASSKALVRNIKKKIENQNLKITLSKLEELDNFEKLVSRNKSIKQIRNQSGKLIHNVEFERLHQLLFSDLENHLQNVEDRICDFSGTKFEALYIIYDQMKEIVEEYKTWECLSIEEFSLLQSHLEEIGNLIRLPNT